MAAYLRAWQLKRLLAPSVGADADILAVYPQRHQQSAKVRVFLDFLSERFAAYRTPALAGESAPW